MAHNICDGYFAVSRASNRPLLRACYVLLALSVFSRSEAQEAVTDTIVVKADRLPNAESTAPFSVEVVTAEELRNAPQLRLDDLLRARVPGFSLFRRSSSRVAHPTTQGVTLRNLGPNGAGRTLVLLDGIPLNDPFAGYVLWNQAPPALLESVLTTSGGGAGLFGNAALAGTIFLISRRAEEDLAMAQGFLGNTETYGAAVIGNLVRKPVAFSLFAESFSTGGYPVLQADQRGKIDTDADGNSELLDLRSEFALNANSTLQLQARGFHEERSNGTRFTGNETRGTDASAVFSARFPQAQAELKLTAYGQRRKFRSTFSSVNEARDLETPALDQFHVPASAAGGSAVWSMALGEEHSLTLGADARWVEGETNEAFRFIENDFTRLRTAGGQQLFVGTFIEDTWRISPAAVIVGSARLDHWRLFDGTRQEVDRANGEITLRSAFPDRDGYSWNGRLGSSVHVSRQAAIRAALYTGFRVPTLNELYRPFRVGNAVTEANAELEPERLFGGEIGLEWRPATPLRLTATAFYNRLEDAIGNITIEVGPGTFDPGGFIPAGGVLRQRQNVGLVTAPGLELTGEWQIAAPLRLRATYLLANPTIAEASEAGLTGNLLAQSPQHVVTGAVEWTPTAKWFLTTQVRYNGRQFEDDQNSTALAPFVVVDAAVSYTFSDRISAAVKIENLFDTEIETGKTLDGLVSIGAPRLVTLQVVYRY
jgi:outer membrane receptor protein involved in Fe transport